MQTAPRVTIGIPTFRRPELLRRSILSALAQDHGNVEVVVSDNHSGDDTEQVCRELAVNEPRLKYIRQHENVGPIRNFNAVRAAATGELFMWLGDDDWIDPSYVSSCVRLLLESPGIAVVGGASRNYQNAEPVGEGAAMNLTHGSPSRRVADFYRAVTDNAILFGVMRRSTIEPCVLTNTLACDWLFMAQVAFRGLVITNPEVSVHREHANRTSQSTKQIVRVLRLPRVQELMPVTSIAVAAVGDVLRNDPVFGSMRSGERVSLATTVGGVILRKMGAKETRRIAVSLIGRERAKRWKAAVARRV